MDLKEVTKKLNEFAPLHLAEKWDNVGLLVEPSPPHSVKSILLTNDLTERVVQEAIDKKVNLVISYHPPIFVPLKRLTSKTFKERIIVKMIENRIAVYSPHTAFDAVKNGVNDWLASGLGDAEVEPLKYSKEGGPSHFKLVTSMSTNQDTDQITRLEDSLKEIEGVKNIVVEALTRLGVFMAPASKDIWVSSAETIQGVGFITARGPGIGGGKVLPIMAYTGRLSPKGVPFSHFRSQDKVGKQISMHCSESGLVDTLQALRSLLSEAAGKTEVIPLAQVPLQGTGQGRLCTLHSPVTLSALIGRIKSHLNLKHVRLAAVHSDVSQSLQSCIQTIALCAGSGAGVLRGKKADVYLTGEMSHHEVLDAVSCGIHVILCEHSNTERGFLAEFKKKLGTLLEEKVDILVSLHDADPLQVL